nr:MAG TPA: hypothetical protein [Caudoviricetes sp.]
MIYYVSQYLFFAQSRLSDLTEFWLRNLSVGN